MSFTASVRSADLSRQVGAVVAKDKNILAIGSNDVPKFKGGTYWPYFDESTGRVEDFENGRDFKVGEDANTKEKNKIINEVLESITAVIEKSVDSERVQNITTEIECTKK
jgi:cytidine deaminase